ncbi:MAG: hypothetical protein A2Y10_08990 [Planctomycetes bacterium GWF2_41_51]|nr:MAG: hypothetical protein A2Y10_08990 [Planctomycetes bacterium GWF2_41_51]HBG26265.1 hypothetical protein [Phycisphaerales bacterium]
MLKIISTTVCFSIIFVSAAHAFEKFMPLHGGDIEIWRITDDPTMRDWPNYHNTDAWSGDGRYMCIERWAWLTQPNFATEMGKGAEVRVFDIKTKKFKFIAEGSQPRWATNHNWLFFIQNGKDVMWYDADSNSTVKLATGILDIGETDAQDRWLYGSTSLIAKRGPKGTIVRIPLKPESQPEVLPEARGIFYLPNPRHPVVLFRVDGLVPWNKRKPFTPIHITTSLEGENEQVLCPELRHTHQTWNGDGEWFLMGNGQVTGRKWNEPFPSNSHYMVNMSFGDVSPCGRSGRWIVGSPGTGTGSLQIADLWSGEGRIYLRALSFVHYYGEYTSAIAFAEPESKGSPDGTKVVFASTYDLKNSPHTKITEDMESAEADKIVVASTEGFPDSGRLSIQSEIIGYKHKTPNSFEGLTREMYGVRAENPATLSYFPPALFEHYRDNRLHLLKGLIVTSFDHRLLSDEQRKNTIMPDVKNLPDDWKDNPVTWQRRSDIYVAVLRRPDRPFLQAAPIEAEEDIQLIPGENHWEIEGYYIYKDNQKLNDDLLKPGQTLNLGTDSRTGSGHLYINAVAVEWSGLESEKSITLTICGKPTLKVLEETPAGFSWKYDRYLVDREEVTQQRADDANEYIKEIVHIYDGILSRQWYVKGTITKQYDVNAKGQAIRRSFFENGLLSRRELHNSDGIKVSEEFFDSAGYIYESKKWTYDIYLNDMVLEKPCLESQWFYDKGKPVKLIGSESYYNYTSFPCIYQLSGDNWIKVKELDPPPVKLKR